MRNIVLDWRAAVSNVLGGIDFSLGVLLIVEPRSRVSGAAFDVAKMIMPMQAWGVLILTIGLAVMVEISRRHEPGLPLVGGASWHAFFTATLAVSAVRTPTVGLTGCIIYTGVVLLHMLCALWTRS